VLKFINLISNILLEAKHPVQSNYLKTAMIYQSLDGYKKLLKFIKYEASKFGSLKSLSVYNLVIGSKLDVNDPLLVKMQSLFFLGTFLICGSAPTFWISYGSVFGKKNYFTVNKKT
jgi:hypothetical protein